MIVTHLEDRTAVLKATVNVMNSAQVDLMGMGRQIAWIDHPDFQKAITDAIKRKVSVRVVGVDEGEVDYFAGKFLNLGVSVRFFEHGDLRVALADTSKAVLSFPLPCTGLSTLREYQGLLIDDPKFCQWLKARFDEIWNNSKEPRKSFIKQIKQDFLSKPAVIIGMIIGALIGAAATIISTLLIK